MTAKTVRIIASIAALCAVIAWLAVRGGRDIQAPSDPQEPVARQPLPEQRRGKAALNRPSAVAASPVNAFFSAPIVFYGLVQTQDGSPIEQAEVTATIAKEFGGGSEKKRFFTDKRGLFSISATGLTLAIQVAKEGYFKVPQGAGNSWRSTGTFDFGADLGSGIHRPVPDEPVVFTLFKPVAVEPLERIPEKEIEMERNGELATVVLDEFNHELELKAWTNDSSKGRDGRYSWKLEIRVPKGGIQLRASALDFIAPEAGYEKVTTIDMPQVLARPNWQDDVERSYWLSFEDGRFAQVNIRMIAGGSHYAILSGYVNPKRESRNLTPEPKSMR